MNVQKFIASSAREALAKARHTFGDTTIILSNRSTPEGIEVVATSDEDLRQIDVSKPSPKPSQPKLLGHNTPAQSSIEEDVDQLAMSTLSFQDYVRERMLRRRHEANLAAQTPIPSKPAVEKAMVSKLSPLTPAPDTELEHPSTRTEPKALASGTILNELHSMKSLIEERFSTLSWFGQASQDPTQASIMLRLIKAGFSPSLARALLERLPAQLSATQGLDWVEQVLQRNLKLSPSGTLVNEGGVFALVGATGVGKTTTAAKLAAQCANRFGAASVGLITLDVTKPGALEQLRQHGRMIGVVTHVAQDRSALEDLLGLLANKKLILIDTGGIGPREQRQRDMSELLNVQGLQRLLVLQASGQGESMEDAVTTYRGEGPVDTILSKTDECVKLAPALDVLIRHQLPLRGLTSGQNVLEDWLEPDRALVIRQALKSAAKSAFDPQAEDLSHLFSHAQSSATLGDLH